MNDKKAWLEGVQRAAERLTLNRIREHYANLRDESDDEDLIARIDEMEARRAEKEARRKAARTQKEPAKKG